MWSVVSPLTARPAIDRRRVIGRKCQKSPRVDARWHGSWVVWKGDESGPCQVARTDLEVDGERRLSCRRAIRRAPTSETLTVDPAGAEPGGIATLAPSPNGTTVFPVDATVRLVWKELPGSAAGAPQAVRSEATRVMATATTRHGSS